MVAGFFGMNLNNGWNSPDVGPDSVPIFREVTTVVSTMVVVCTVVVYTYLKKVGVICE